MMKHPSPLPMLPPLKQPQLSLGRNSLLTESR
jgi:hypothetical protein